MTRLFIVIHLIFALTLSAANAHPNLQNSLSVAFEQTRIQVDINVSVKELSVAHGIEGLPVNGVGRLDTAAIKRAAESHRAYLLAHLKLSAGGRVLEGKITSLASPPFFADPVQTFYQYSIEYPLLDSSFAELTLLHEMLREWPYSVGTPWNVSYAVTVKQDSCKLATSWLMPYQQAITIPTGWKNPDVAAPVVRTSDHWRSFREYLRHGVTHILTGYDHLLFVMALVIGTKSLWEMVKVIAAFTVAHSLTLTLCVFGLVRLPTSIVEPLIAASIIFVALENIIRVQGVRVKIRLVVAFGFGLIHGLGFAGGLLDVMAGLPPISLWIALVAFSLGVEIGHQMIVLPLCGLLSMTHKKHTQGTDACFRRYGSAAIALGGVYFLVVALKQQWLS